MKTPDEKAEAMYGASKRLHDDMDRHDRQMLATAIAMLAATIFLVGAMAWAFWRFVL
jgi:hypothetical protein